MQQTSGNLSWLGANGLLNGQGLSMDALGALANGSQNVQASTNPYLGQTTNVGANAYAGSNPYLQQMIDKSNGDITNQFQKA